MLSEALLSPPCLRNYIALGAVLVAILPVIALCRWLRAQREADAALAKSPLTENLLRHPGQSTMEQAKRLREALDEEAISVVLFPLLGALFGAMQYPENTGIGMGIFAVCLAGLILPARKIRKIRSEISNYELGAAGEWAVAQHLDALKAKGATVFHDVQMDGYNIDHVVVTESAVFSVETKTRRKPAGEKGRTKIVYRDGVTHFPWGPEDFGVEQARRQARSLGEFLTKECGVKITPFPILTFPGWWVEEVSVDADLIVCNPGQIGHHLKAVDAQPLKGEIRNRIVEKLREKASI